MFEDEDSQLYSSIQQLARISKCPILLTTEKSLDFFKALNASILNFSRPDPLKVRIIYKIYISIIIVCIILVVHFYEYIFRMHLAY